MYKVLVVEDEAILRRGFIDFIPWEQFYCTVCGSAKDGLEGLELIRKLEPDIVFTDLKMPRMDGLNMLFNSKEQYGYEAVIISGYSEFEYARKALLARVEDYLLKPVDRDQMKAVLKKLVDKLNTKQGGNTPPDISLGAEVSPYTVQCIRYIAQNYQNPISVSDIAGVLCLSEDYLGHVFKKDTGKSPHEYLINFRITKAKELLKDKPELKVYQVANLTGFKEYKRFHQVFTGMTGYSPSQYKAKSALSFLPESESRIIEAVPELLGGEDRNGEET
jgi:two-component system response regulator YesN